MWVSEILAHGAPQILEYNVTKVKKKKCLSWIIYQLGGSPSSLHTFAYRNLHVTPRPGISHTAGAMLKYANRDFQLRQVQHSSTNGEEAPFLSHLGSDSSKGREGLCTTRTRAMKSNQCWEKGWGGSVLEYLAASWMASVRFCSRACLSWKELTAGITHPDCPLLPAV